MWLVVGVAASVFAVAAATARCRSRAAAPPFRPPPLPPPSSAGARHAGLDIAGQDVVNPTGILLASVQMLRYLKLPNFGDRVERAIYDTCVAVCVGRVDWLGAWVASRRSSASPPRLTARRSMESGIKTRDVGGSSSTTAVVDAIVERLVRGVPWVACVRRICCIISSRWFTPTRL